MTDFKNELEGLSFSLTTHFHDRMDPKERKRILELVFERDIFKSESGGFLEKRAVRGDVLDLGCGRGSVGAMLKDINREIKLTGVDITNYGQENNLWDLYSEIRENNAVEEVDQIAGNNKQYDFVIGHGLPPETNEELIKEGNITRIIKPGGILLLVFDLPIRETVLQQARKMGFEIRKGNYPTDQNILSWQAPEEETAHQPGNSL